MQSTNFVFEDIALKVRHIIAEGLNRPVEEIRLDARLDSPELAMDSLNLIKLNVILEETFDITMPDFNPDQNELRSVRDVVNLIAGKVSGAGASAQAGAR
jgi:acyl carrier protein